MANFVITVVASLWCLAVIFGLSPLILAHTISSSFASTNRLPLATLALYMKSTRPNQPSRSKMLSHMALKAAAVVVAKRLALQTKSTST